jgi:hypothetical protein
VKVLDDGFGAGFTPTDEGRAMSELIFDMGSGFDILFHSGDVLPSDWAGAYEELFQAGADVIVDDLSNFAEPIFQDGAIAQAIDKVYNDHKVLVFGSAGNQDDKGLFTTWSDPDDDGLFNFASGDETANFTLGKGDTINVYLQWSQPWFTDIADLDIEVWNSAVTQKLADSDGFNFYNVAFETLSFTNNTTSTQTYHLIFRETLGTHADGLTLSMISNDNKGTLQYTENYTTNEPSITGNHAASKIFAIGAAPYNNISTLEGFSSHGPNTIFFNDDGSRKSTPVVRQKPDFVAADGVDTSFFPAGTGQDFDNTGKPNFFGTSAAAPDAAAVAGLLLQMAGGPGKLTFTQLSNLFRDTADGPTAGTGWDPGWGLGRIDAIAASMKLRGPASELFVELNPFGDATFGDSFTSNTDIDAFNFVVDAPSGVATISTNSDLDAAMVLWNDEDNTFVGEDSIRAASASLTKTLSTATLYQATVYTQTNLAGADSYNFVINAASPSVGGVGAFNGFGDASLTGALATRKSAYYSFVAPGAATGNLTLILTPSSTLDGVITLYNSSGATIVRRNAGASGVPERIDITNAVGGATYYLRVGSSNYATSGSFNININFDVPPPSNGRLSGLKWNDTDSDGFKDTGEPVMPGVRVFLDQNNNGLLDGNETWQLTDATGKYNFNGLSAGTYFIADEDEPGWTQTNPEINGSFERNDFLGWDRIGAAFITTSAFGSGPTNGAFQALLTTGVGSKTDAQIEAFAPYVAGTIDQFVGGNATEGSAIRKIFNVEAGTQLSFDWQFLTNHGAGSTSNDQLFISVLPANGAGNPTLKLADTNSPMVTSSTDYGRQTGYNTYSLTFNSFGSFVLTIGIVDVATTGTDSAVLLDNLRIVPAGGGTLQPGSYQRTLAASQVVDNLDFGTHQNAPSQIRGNKWNDLNSNGVKDTGEPALANWTVYLDENSNGKLDSGETATVTDASGNYAFTTLLDGTYTVAEVQQSGWQQTTPRSPVGIDQEIRITEIGRDAPDFIEFENVSSRSVSTFGWRMALSDSTTDINVVNPTLLSMPSAIAPGRVVYKTDDTLDQPWGSNINYAAGSAGWAMIINDEGRIIDFVGWGWTSAQLASFNVTVNGFNIAGLASAWSGAAISAAGTGTIQRTGGSDTNIAADFVYSTATSKGEQNAILVAPARVVTVGVEQTVNNVNFASQQIVTPSTPSAPDLVAGSDSGSSSADNITNVTAPTFSGTATTGTLVRLFASGQLVGSATATGGTYSIASSPLGGGTWSMTAIAYDAGGNASDPSTPLSIKIDTAAPLAATPDLDTASDSGVSNSDNLTNDSTPSFIGTVEPGATVKIFAAGTLVGTGTANSSGAYSVTTSTLTNGIRSITATATDPAGNVSAASSALSVTIDTIAPTLALTPLFGFNAAPHTLELRFSENVGPTVQAADLQVQNLSAGGTFAPGSVSYVAASNAATFSFSGVSGGIAPGALPEGNFRSTVSANLISDLAGNGFAATTFDFFFTNADANHDRSVDLTDFTLLAANFNQTGRTFAQGNFNYDSMVDLTDFTILASSFNKSLAPAAAASASFASAALVAPSAPSAATGHFTVGNGDDSIELLPDSLQ